MSITLANLPIDVLRARAARLREQIGAAHAHLERLDRALAEREREAQRLWEKERAVVASRPPHTRRKINTLLCAYGVSQR